MYLSKLTLDSHNAQVRRDLSNPYEMHRTLTRAFVTDASTPPCRFLWRQERNADSTHSVVVLVQSDEVADWTALNAVPRYVQEILGNRLVELDRLVTDRSRYRFRLFANPTVSRSGKRHGLTHEDEQMAWLDRQGERYGFSVVGCVRAASERTQIRKSKSRDQIVVQGALFEGVLEANDAARVREAIRAGLGHAKAFGLGLLSLARIS